MTRHKDKLGNILWEKFVAAVLSPALHRYEQEASIIGRLLTGYSGLEYQLCMCAGMGGSDVEKAIVDLFSKRGEARRVEIANRLGGAAYATAGLGQEFEAAIDDILFCVSIRNLYAHCIWHDDLTGRLAFAQMEEIATPNGPGADPVNLTFHYLDVDLLRKQESFFVYVRDNLNYLNYKRRQLVRNIGAGANLRLPMVVARPRQYL